MRVVPLDGTDADVGAEISPGTATDAVCVYVQASTAQRGCRRACHSCGLHRGPRRATQSISEEIVVSRGLEYGTTLKRACCRRHLG